MQCEKCQEKRGTNHAHFLSTAVVRLPNPRYSILLQECLDRVPHGATPIQLPTRISLKQRGPLPGVVGLTTFLIGGYRSEGGKREEPGKHTVTFYSGLMSQLSDGAVMGVMAHELAHAWLNEHVRPEASDQREEDADILAEMWGFENELKALADETEPYTPN